MSKSRFDSLFEPRRICHVARLTVPSADDYPRRGAGRKGAFGVACDGARRHPCPRHHDEHRGQDEGTGHEQGRIWYMNGPESPCPPRALQGSHSRSFTANHGQSKSLLNGSVLARSCSSQALNTGSIQSSGIIKSPDENYSVSLSSAMPKIRVPHILDCESRLFGGGKFGIHGVTTSATRPANRGFSPLRERYTAPVIASQASQNRLGPHI
jgi:hypothetical protein